MRQPFSCVRPHALCVIWTASFVVGESRVRRAEIVSDVCLFSSVGESALSIVAPPYIFQKAANIDYRMSHLVEHSQNRIPSEYVLNFICFSTCNLCLKGDILTQGALYFTFSCSCAFHACHYSCFI